MQSRMQHIHSRVVGFTMWHPLGIVLALVSHLLTGFLEEDTPHEKPPALRLLLTLLHQMDTWLEGSRRYPFPWAKTLTESAADFLQDGFLWSDDQQLLFGGDPPLCRSAEGGQ